MAWVAGAAALALLFLARGRGDNRRRGVDRLLYLQGEERGPTASAKGRGQSLALTFLELPYRLTPKRFRSILTGGLPEPPAQADSMTREMLAGLRLWAAAGFPAIALLMFRFTPAALASAPALSVPGFLLPRWIISRRRNRFEESVRQGLPQAADMLYAFVLGGKNLDQAFRGAAEASAEPLGALLQRSVREMELGASRDEAFARLLERCPLPELASLLRTLSEAERRGHSLSATLEVFSREIRLRRRDQLRVMVAKAPLKMLAPLVFLILPASVLLTVGPTFLVTLKKVL